MKKAFLALLGVFLAIPLSAQTFVGGTIGMYDISAFAYGSAGGGGALQVGGGGGTSGSYTITLNYGQTSAIPGGYPLQPFSGVTLPSFGIGSGATFEVVTPSAASCATPAVYQTCTVTATFTYAHGPGDVVRSADGGLQEAILWAGKAGHGIGPIQAVFSIPSSLIETMFTTAVPLLPVPGTHQFYNVLKAVLTNESAGTAFTGGGAIEVAYGTTAASPTTDALTGTIAATFLTSPTAFETTSLNGAALAVGATSLVADLPISITNATAVFATGTTPLRVSLEFYVEHD